MGAFIRYSCCKPSLIEAFFVLIILGGVACASGGRAADGLSAFAGFLSFLCTQIAFDMNEQLQAAQDNGISPQHRYRNLFFLKEGVWVVTFLLLGSYPLLASTAVFASYPWWRRRLRTVGAGIDV
jgi:hypothetical protein